MPSGWHHTVENLEDTLSINHNWVNGHNIHEGWALLRRERADAAVAIEDCRCALHTVKRKSREPAPSGGIAEADCRASRNLEVDQHITGTGKHCNLAAAYPALGLVPREGSRTGRPTF